MLNEVSQHSALLFCNDIFLVFIIFGACSTYGERLGVYRVWVGKPERKGPLGRPRHRWENNIMMDLQEVGCGGMD